MTGLLGVLAGASAPSLRDADPRPFPECYEQDTYVVSRQHREGHLVGIGYVCEDSARYYGWMDAADTSSTLTSLLHEESGGQNRRTQYHAGLLDSTFQGFKREIRIPVSIGPRHAKTEFRFLWKGFYPTKVTVELERDEAWRMRAVAKPFLFPSFSLDCSIDETMRYTCPKE